MSIEAEAYRQRSLLQALWQEAGPAPAAQGPQAARLCEAAGLRERGERLRLGLGTYRAHADATAARALAATYPTVVAMVGQEALGWLARALWQASPPRRGDLGQWGQDLPGFIASRRDLEPWPYLADAARLDLAVLRCESAADAEPETATLSLLTTHSPAQLRLRLLPSVQLLASCWPIATLHAVHRGLAGTGIDAPTDPTQHHLLADDARLAPAREALAAGRAESVVVARAGWRAVVHEVAASNFAWMQALHEGQALDSALAQSGSGFDFEAWLRQALAAGWLLRAELRDDGPLDPVGAPFTRESAEDVDPAPAAPHAAPAFPNLQGRTCRDDP